MSDSWKGSSEGSTGGPPELEGGLSQQDREALRRIVLESIQRGLETGLAMDVDAGEYSPALQEPGASFVTLEIEGVLRGCVGSLQARLPLAEDVAKNAYAAAFQDYRFSPLIEDELARVEFHISRLSPLVPLEVESREELLASLRPGVDGLLIEDPPHRSTFLPQVWESLEDAETFLGELMEKAGLPPCHWSSTLRVHLYWVEEF